MKMQNPVNSRWLASGLILLALAASTAPAAEPAGQPVDPAALIASAIETARRDVSADVQELSTLRDRISEARRPLAAELSAVEARVARLRERSRQLRTVRQQTEQSHATLRRDVDFLQDDCRFILALLSEYRRSMGTRANPPESARESSPRSGAFTAIDAALTEADDYAGLPAAGAGLLNMAARWSRTRLGGYSFEGSCLDAGGVQHAGRFALVGPLSYFSTPSADVAGLVVMRLDSSMPSVFPGATTAERQATLHLVSGRESPVPVDLSAGDALKMAAARESWPEHVKKGGFVMVPILLVAVIAALLAALKLLQLRRLHGRGGQDMSQDIIPVLECLRAGDLAGASAAAARLDEPLATIVRDGLEHRDAPKEHVEEILHEHLLGHIPVLEKHLGTLAVLGGITPLLGLLGTVTGMIHTFKLATLFGTGNAKLLSGGISEALITTEYGLYVAIPVLLLHAFFSRRVRTLIGALERSVVRFVNELSLSRKPL